MKLMTIFLQERRERKHKERQATFHTYSCYFIVKVKKDFNKNEMIERIRGIKNVTIVDVENEPKFDNFNRKNKEYQISLVQIKFNTNQSPEEEIEDIKYALIKSDINREIYNIIGIVHAKEKPDSLEKID